MKSTFTLLLLFYSFLNLEAQVSIQNLGNGTYQYTSQLSTEDLHFYIFDDGYHSFEMNPTHQFGSNANPSNVKLYHTEPYSGDEPIDEDLNVVYNGVQNPVIQELGFDNKITLKRSWNLVNQQSDFFILMFENRESQSAISGCVEFHYDSNKLHINSNTILDNYNNNWVYNRINSNSDYDGFNKKFVWDYEDLEYGEQRFVYIPIKCLAPSMSHVLTRGVMKVNSCSGTIPWNLDNDGAMPFNTTVPYYTYKSIVRNNPHDPNCIVASQGCLSDQDLIFTERYRVYFQNEGEDPAINVLLDYVIDAPVYNVTLVDASHSCQLTIDNGTFNLASSNSTGLEINFDNIFLKGLNEVPPPSYDKTIGWVEFDVCYDLSLFTQMGIPCARSSVDIYFDFEPPVSALNYICRSSDCSDDVALVSSQSEFRCPDILLPHQVIVKHDRDFNIIQPSTNLVDSELTIVPNPSQDYISVDGHVDNVTKIYIVDTKGQVIREMNKYEIGRIDISNLQSGVYFVTFVSSQNVNTKSFVKI